MSAVNCLQYIYCTHGTVEQNEERWDRPPSSNRNSSWPRFREWRKFLAVKFPAAKFSRQNYRSRIIIIGEQAPACTCVHVCVLSLIYIGPHVPSHLYAKICMYTHVYMHIQECTHKCACAYACAHTDTRTHILTLIVFAVDTPRRLFSIVSGVASV